MSRIVKNDHCDQLTELYMPFIFVTHNCDDGEGFL